MIPIKLSIKGLYSYQEKQSIDFAKLTSAHLFGIFGTVGSGKSAILEAITFALYGKTERLNLSGDNRNYNMMNLKSDELLIEYIFKTGNPAKEYQVIVRGRRNSKKFDDVKTLERTAYFNNDECWEPIPIEQIEEVIGLSYENFKRTIIIPQGMFQEFLQLSQKDRSQMMKELFNLQRFELFYKVVTLESRNNEKLFTLEGRLKELGEIQPIQVEEKKKEFMELQLQVNELKAKLEKSTHTKIAFDRLRDLHARLIQQQQKVETLLNQQEEIAILEKRLADYEYCLIHFKPLLDGLADAEKRLNENSLEVAQCKTALEQALSEIEKSKPAFDTLKKDFENRGILLQQAEELHKMKRIVILKSDRLQLNQRIEDGEKHNQSFQTKLENMKLEYQKYLLLVKEHKSQRIDITEITSAKSWYLQQVVLKKQIDDLYFEVQQLEKEQLIVYENFKLLTQNPIIFNKIELLDVDTLIRYLESEINRFGILLSENEEQAGHFSVQAKLSEYASNLNDGKPCPLCGSLEHPYIFNSLEAANELHKLRKSNEAIKQNVLSVQQILQQATKYQMLFQAHQKTVTDLKTKLAMLQKRYEEHQQHFAWDNYPTIELLNAAFLGMETLEKQIALTEKQMEFILKEVETDQQKLFHYKQTLDDFKHQLTGIDRETDILKKQLNVISFEQWVDADAEMIGIEISKFLARIDSLEKQYHEKQFQLETLQHTQETLAGKLSLRSQDIEREKRFIENKRYEVVLMLEKSQFTELKDILGVLSVPLDLVTEKLRVEIYKQHLAIAHEQLQIILTEIDEKKYDFEAHKVLENELEQLNEVFISKNKMLINAESYLVKLETDLAKQLLLINEKEQLEIRSVNLKTFKQLFQGSKFVNYISTVHLQNLCNDANNRFFKLSGQKLSLEIAEDNSFQVRDFMNDGKVRHVKTLSGGQIFQAALSLALALADSVQKNSTSKENFFFLDEGFGSLDKESLQIVFETLKTLRNENRIVGIISHVEELQQEIDTHIRLTILENSGSFITSNY